MDSNENRQQTELLTRQEAAAFLNVEYQTLSIWAVTGRYSLPFIKVGRKAMYRHSDLESWIVSRTSCNTRTIAAAV